MRTEGYVCCVREWPAAVERVAAFLREARAEARIEEFPEGTPTAQAAAEAVGCELAQIVKSLVVACDGRPVVVLVPGDRRADVRKVAAAVGAREARVARPEEVEAATGFAPGAVAPFPLPRVRDVLVERTLLTHDVVWVGAGSDRHMAGLAPAELVRLARARPMDAVQAPT
jgi:Cys-tRNA(Pro) deacylase